jgi:hypothetical protein
MQAKQDEEIKSLGLSDFTQSEALHWPQNLAANRKFIVRSSHDLLFMLAGACMVH